MLAKQIWAEYFTSRDVVLYTDNESVKEAIVKGSSSRLASRRAGGAWRWCRRTVIRPMRPVGVLRSFLSAALWECVMLLLTNGVWLAAFRVSV
eukprot:4490459-Amphidinium_carterae.2